MLESINAEYQPIEDEAYQIFEAVYNARPVKTKLEALLTKTEGLVNAVDAAPDIDENTKETMLKEVRDLSMKAMNLDSSLGDVVYTKERWAHVAHLEAVIDLLK
jgi:hypothetical protein